MMQLGSIYPLGADLLLRCGAASVLGQLAAASAAAQHAHVSRPQPAAAAPAPVLRQPPRAAMHTTPTGRDEPPVIVPDRDGPMPGARSSEEMSVRPVSDERLKRLVDDVFVLYEARDLRAQRRIIARHYADDAIYQNNIMRIQGVEGIAKRFSLLPRTTKSVAITYEPPVVLAAATSSPDALGNLGFMGDLEVEVKNSQRYEFEHPGMLRLLVTGGLPDVELPVLTRLALDKASYKVLHHQDVWLNKASIWGPLRKGWGAAASAAASVVSPPAVDDPGRQPRRPRRGEEGEQSEKEEEESQERVGQERRGGGGSGGGKEGEDAGLRRSPPGVEPVPA